MDDLELRELRYFTAVAEELHFGRAAERLRMSQPPLSRAIQRLEHRLGVRLLDRDRRGVRLTRSGAVLLEEARNVFDATAAALARTKGADAGGPLVLVTKAGASHDVLRHLLAACAGGPDPVQVEVLLCEVGEQRRLLREGRADAALMHRPYDVEDGFSTRELLTEGQVAVVPKGHPLALRARLALEEVSAVPDLPVARWPRHDGSYPEGPGPEVRTQSQIAQLVSLGRALLVIPASSRAWQWPDHVAVPVLDAPPVTTLLAWRPTSRGSRFLRLMEAADVVAAQEHLARTA